MSQRPLIARLILWRGNAPTIAAVGIGMLLVRFGPGWQPWGILLAALLVGIAIAGSLVLNAKHTSRVETLVAQLMRVNHKLNGEIQERARIETELACARDEALELSRLKSQFLATMSHEIRTPMNGIIGMTDLLLDTDLNEDQREFAEAARRCSGSLMEIIDDILDFAKIETCTLKLQPREFETRGILDGVLDLLTPRAQAKGLILTRDLSNELPEALIGDPGRLRQMLIILIGNAIKFTERGEVFVEAKLAERAEDSVTLRVDVHDTGIGISPGQQGRLFESFYQTDGSSTRKYGGAGLGLAICKQLAELMEGKIELESQLGKGSIFHLSVKMELPVKDHSKGLTGLAQWTGASPVLESVHPKSRFSIH